MTQLFKELLEETLTETIYDAELAGLRLKFSDSEHGFKVSN